MPPSLNEPMDFGPYEIMTLDVQRSKLREESQVSVKSKMKMSVLTTLKRVYYNKKCVFICFFVINVIYMC